jgi:hypothetical protein
MTNVSVSGSLITRIRKAIETASALEQGFSNADSDEVAQGFRFDGAHHSEMMSPISRSLAGG